MKMFRNKPDCPRPDNSIKQNEAGFTLIELLVTMIVLGIAITSLSGMYYVMQDVGLQSTYEDVAVRADRSEIESLRNTGYDGLTPGTDINFTSSLPSSLPKNATGTVAVSQPFSGLIRVDSTVQYSLNGKTQTVELSSDIGIIGISQGQ